MLFRYVPISHVHCRLKKKALKQILYKIHVLAKYRLTPYPIGPTVVAQPVAVVACQSMRESPVRVSCTSCRADIMTATTFETGTMTWLLVGILCIIG